MATSPNPYDQFDANPYDQFDPGVPGAGKQAAFEEVARQLLPSGTPKGLQDTVLGILQGLRELGHGTFERVAPALTAGVGPMHALNPQLDQSVADETGSMQAQEQTYNQMHPSDSAVPGVNESGPMNTAKNVTELAPYFNPLAMEGKVGSMLAGNVLAGATQPMQPGENPLSAPLVSGAGAAALGVPFAILNKTIVKGYNSGALKDVIDKMGVPKTSLTSQSAYQEIKNFAASEIPENAPAFKQQGKARAFVKTIEDIQGSPISQVALRSDVGAQYLKNAVESSELYAKRDALGAKLGPIDTTPLVNKLNEFLQEPSTQALLESRGVANRSMDILKGGAQPPSQFGGINLEGQPDSVKAAFGLLSNPAAKIDYSTLSTIRSNLDKAATDLRGDKSSVFYSQAARLVDDFQAQLANKAGGELANADKMARAHYKNSVVPYLEKGLAKKLSDPKTESGTIYKMFTDFTGNNPERASRFYNLISPSGQDAVRAGVYSDALAAATDRTGFVDPVAVRDFMEAVPGTTSKYMVKPEDKQILQGIANLIDSHAVRLGRANETYQRYLMGYGVENMITGNLAHGAKQISAPFFYNWLYRTTYTNPAIKRFAIASSKLNPDSPAAAEAVVKFTRMLRQAGIGELTQYDQSTQAVDSLLKTGE